MRIYMYNSTCKSLWIKKTSAGKLGVKGKHLLVFKQVSANSQFLKNIKTTIELDLYLTL